MACHLGDTTALHLHSCAQRGRRCEVESEGVATITSLIKKYLRELPHALMDEELFDCWLNAVGSGREQGTGGRASHPHRIAPPHVHVRALIDGGPG